jgi:hypothetical protein
MGGSFHGISLRYTPDIWLKGLGETKINSRQDSRSSVEIEPGNPRMQVKFCATKLD